MALNRRTATAAIDEDAAAAGREFVFSGADFQYLSKLAYEQTGIVLGDSKRNLVYGRLSRRLRSLRLSSFAEYRDYLAENEHEIESFINSISTNHTKFFRESHHFDHLRDHVAAPFGQAGRNRLDHKLRIWSAGCSSGEEPYTIAAVLKRDIPDVEQKDVRILATDIDTDILKRAMTGDYQSRSIDEIPEAYRRYFEGGRNSKSSGIILDDALRSLIAFRRLNLLGPWPFKGLFDAIFCRNVMIYFDAPTKAALVDRFMMQLKPGGWLYIGHSESLIGSHPGLRSVGRTIYRRDA
ncbi:protein-glutamate O-methyltransferase CheR [Terrarubrum flagellatum]|uniref:CheR family methyltransferase n=1 Tax=Terrirubrum flagellatum TaxID=2895980 RepID=UPI003144D5E4